MLVIIFGRSRTGSQTAKPAFVVLGARRYVSLCEARFSAPLPPLPPPSPSPLLIIIAHPLILTLRLRYVTGELNLRPITRQLLLYKRLLNFLFFTFQCYSFVVILVDENFYRSYIF